MAGFCVGAADKSKILDNSRTAPGDVLVALPSTGVHSNGFSLVRKVLGDTASQLDRFVPELSSTLLETLLTPTAIYVKPALAVLEACDVKGISHITGGGFYENIPRCLPEGMSAKIDKQALKTLPIFDVIAAAGKIPERDMFNTFNMGVGMTMTVSRTQADRAVDILKNCGVDAYVCGEVISSDDGVVM